MFIVYINLQILASIFYSLFHIFYLLLVYYSYSIFSILLLAPLITELTSVCLIWIAFHYIWEKINKNKSHPTIRILADGSYSYFLIYIWTTMSNYCWNAFNRLGIICFLRDITPGRIATLSSGVTPNPRSITPSASGPQISRCVVSSKMFVNIKNT